MSIKLMGSVWESAPFSQTALLVLLALADHANDDGVCWPAVSSIAAKARTSERRVRQVLVELEVAGWLQRQQRYNDTTLFRLTPQCDPLKPSSGVKPSSPPEAQFRGGVKPSSGDPLKPSSVPPETGFTLTTKNHQMNRQGTVTTRDDAFDEFWTSYPRKAGKDAARRAWAKAIKRTDVVEILAGVHQFAADPNLPEPQYVPHPTTWLNGGRWDDDPLPARREGPLDKQAEILRREMARAKAADAGAHGPQIGAA